MTFDNPLEQPEQRHRGIAGRDARRPRERRSAATQAIRAALRHAWMGSLICIPAVLAWATAAAQSSQLPMPAQLPGDWQTFANADDVLSMARQEGVLWVGSRSGGVVRWDVTTGEFKQYLAPQAPLAGNTVRDIAIDGLGRKWFATDAGLTLLNDAGTESDEDDIWRTYTRENTFGGLPSNDVRAVAIDGDWVWVGGHQVWLTDLGWRFGGVGRLDTEGTLRTDDDTWAAVATFENTQEEAHDGSSILGLVSDNVNDIQVAPGGHIWVATAPHRRLERPANPEKPREWQLAHGGLSHLILEADGSMLPTGWDPYTCEDPLTDLSGRPLISCDMAALALDGEARLWVAAGGLGVVSMPSTTRIVVAGAVTRFDEAAGTDLGFVDAVAVAEPDEVWMGLRSGGVARVKHQGTLRAKGDDEWQQVRRSDGLPRDRVQSLIVADGAVWLGTGPDKGIGGGVASLDRASLTMNGTLLTAGRNGVPTTNFLSAVDVGELGEPWAGHVWIATGSRFQRVFGEGVLEIDTKGTRSAKDDAITVHTTSGTDPDRTPPFVGLQGDNVHAIMVDGEQIWAGSTESLWDAQARDFVDGGLASYDGEQWRAWPQPAPDGETRGRSISSLAAGCDGSIWAGTGSRWTDGAGLLELDPGDPPDPSQAQWNRVRFPDTASNEVADVAVSCVTGEVWAASPYHTLNGEWTDGGVAVRRGTNWRRYDENTGLESYSAGRIRGVGLSLALSGNDVWIGTFGTRSMTEAELIATNPYWPATVNLLSGEQWTAATVPGVGQVSDMLVDSRGRLWVALTRGGLARESTSPDSWVEDRHLAGILLKDGDDWWSLGIPQGLPSNDVSGLATRADGTVWVVTQGRGYARYSPEGPTPTPTATHDNPSPTPTSTFTATSTRTPVTHTPTGSASPRSPTPTGSAERTSTPPTPGTRTTRDLNRRIFAPSVHQR